MVFPRSFSKLAFQCSSAIQGLPGVMKPTKVCKEERPHDPVVCSSGPALGMKAARESGGHWCAAGRKGSSIQRGLTETAYCLSF